MQATPPLETRAGREVLSELLRRYRLVRAASEALCAVLSPEDAQAQSMLETSPAKWHLAHTTWFFETLVIEPNSPGHRWFDPDFCVLFNSYYNSLGGQYSRPARGLLTRPSLARVLDYRAHVDAQIERVVDGTPSLAASELLELGLHHEQQHQELMLTDVKHLLSCNPVHPCYRGRESEDSGTPAPLEWLDFDSGLRQIGHDRAGFAFDNEGPRHRVFQRGFQMASRPATNLEYRSFIEQGGYARPEFWLSDGWATVQREHWVRPIYWQPDEDHEFTLAGLQPIDPHAPVCHLSYYEADAFARWTGARLPTEAEWEIAAVAHAAEDEGSFVENWRLHPTRTRAPGFLGNVWEWTQSPYVAYPGFRVPEGAVGEYNGKFMANQVVLRGGSCATPASHIRATYRNFLYPDARWQFSGLRLARDI